MRFPWVQQGRASMQFFSQALFSMSLPKVSFLFNHTIVASICALEIKHTSVGGPLKEEVRVQPSRKSEEFQN